MPALARLTGSLSSGGVKGVALSLDSVAGTDRASALAEFEKYFASVTRPAPSGLADADFVAVLRSGSGVELQVNSTRPKGSEGSLGYLLDVEAAVAAQLRNRLQDVIA